MATLGDFLKEVSNWDWYEYAVAERDKAGYTSNQAIIFGLIRSCAAQKMDAITLSIKRLDGNLKTPIKFEYPKVYTVYPYATSVAEPDTTKKLTVIDEVADASDIDFSAIEKVEDEPAPPKDLPSMGIRETIKEMAEYPRELPEKIIELAQQAEQFMHHHAKKPAEIPKVKSVVAAHLLIMAQQRNMAAIGEVFDAIDGKLVEIIQVVGKDIHLVSYDSVAPAGSIKNADGAYQIEALEIQNNWALRLGKEE